MQDNIPNHRHERWIAALEATGRYRVLRRVAPRLDLQVGGDPSPVRRGLIVSIAATGPDPGCDEVLELAMLPFAYCRQTGKVHATSSPYHGLRQPSRPLPQDHLARIGLTEKELAGREIEVGAIEPYADEADLVIAHGAALVRPFAEALALSFADRAWACSMTQIPWHAEGHDSHGLAWLAMANGLYFGDGRPLDQCHALLSLLMGPLLSSGGPPLQMLLSDARRPSYRIWADAAPDTARAAMRQRGYRCHRPTRDRPETWSIDVPAGRLNDETRWLHREIYNFPFHLRIERLTARTRYSCQWSDDDDRM